MSRRMLLAAVILDALGCARRMSPPPPPAPVQKAVFTPVPQEEAAAAKNPHDHGGKPLCQRCHEPGVAGVIKDPIALCADCHDVARMRHPFRVQAPAHAQGLPLMPGGIVACHTCHDPHDVKARRSGLRMPFAELCLKCHQRHASPPKPAAPPPGHEAATRSRR